MTAMTTKEIKEMKTNKNDYRGGWFFSCATTATTVTVNVKPIPSGKNEYQGVSRRQMILGRK
jgi:hypothetical protein